MFFGMYPSKYIAGTPFGVSNAPFFMTGNHPSAILRANYNYFATGNNSVQTQIPVQMTAATVPANISTAQNNVSIPINNQIQNDRFIPNDLQSQVNNLQNALNNAKNEQGLIGKTIDNIKGTFGIGISSKKCQSYIEALKSGQATYEEAYNNILKYQSKQKNGVNIAAGIISGTLAAAATGFKPATGSKLKQVLMAATVGAAAKAGIKTTERGTNNVQNDALNPALIAKDGLSGALDGAVSASVIGIGKEAVLGASTKKEAIKQGVIAGAKGGAISGGVIGAGDYTIDCAFGEQKFEADNLITNAAYGAGLGAVTGGVTGGIVAGKNFNKGEIPVNPKGNNPLDDGPDGKIKPEGSLKTDDITPKDTKDTPVITPDDAKLTPEKTSPEALPQFDPYKKGQSADDYIMEQISAQMKKDAASKKPVGLLGDGSTKAAEPDIEVLTPDEIIMPNETANKGVKTAEPKDIIDVDYIEIKDAIPDGKAEPLLSGGSSPQIEPPVKPQAEAKIDPLKDNFSKTISGIKKGTSIDSTSDDIVKQNASRVITGKKSGILAKIKGIFTKE